MVMPVFAVGNEVWRLHPVLTAFTRYPAGVRSQPHLHPVYHLVFILRGEGRLEHDAGTVTMRPQDVMVIDPGERHVFTGGSKTVENFAFNFMLLPHGEALHNPGGAGSSTTAAMTVDQMASRMPFARIFGITASDHRLVRSPATAAWDTIVALVHDLHQQVLPLAATPAERLTPDEVMRYRHCATLFLLRFLSLFRPDLHTPMAGTSTDNDLLARETMRLLSGAIHARYDLRAIARKLGYAPAYVCTRFRRVVGRTPGAYLMKLKIEKSCEYLAETLMPVDRIAAELGFSSVQHFCTAFRKAKGVSPGRFRRSLVLV